MAGEPLAADPSASERGLTAPWCIKAGYQERLERPEYFDDTNGEGVTSQPDVYPRAAQLAGLLGATHLLDLGCGRAQKLAALHELHPHLAITGVDHGPNIEHCRQEYSWGRWIDHDLELAPVVKAPNTLVICADVIEHLVDPRPLLEAVRWSAAVATLLSTPERDLTHGEAHQGPPPNPCHVREWNAMELVAFLDQQGLEVVRMELTRSDDAASLRHTLLAQVVGR